MGSMLLFHVAQIALMLQGTHDPGKKKERENLVNEAITVSDSARKCLQHCTMSLGPIVCKGRSRT